MKNLLQKVMHLLLIIVLAGVVFVGTFFYENTFGKIEARKITNQIVLETYGNGKIRVDRAGQTLEAGNGFKLEMGDLVNAQNQDNFYIKYGGDGVLRLDKETQLSLKTFDQETGNIQIEIVSGRVWLNGLYANTDLGLISGKALLLSGQSVLYLDRNDTQSEIYVNRGSVKVLFVDELNQKVIVNEQDERVINNLLLPQSTALTVYDNKIIENKETISRLLFSKLVKEFNYSIFDDSKLIADEWLSRNVEKDLGLTTIIRDQRLKKIRTRGLKYSSLDAANYHLDQWLKDFSNILTFSDQRVGDRNMEALYDFLYDAQYLFDYGRKAEAQERLSVFTAAANQMFIVYGEDLKDQYRRRVKNEYDYLSFANPSDSLFGLKQVLEKIYLDSVSGTADEQNVKFGFLTEKTGVMAYYAENRDFKNLKQTFDEYMVVFKDLIDKNSGNNLAISSFVQQQNQILDNLLIIYPDFYRQDIFTNKLFVENKYLSLLPSTKDKIEETQTVIAQRISFLKRLQEFFLDNEIPLIDAQNIVALLFTEISKIDLPKENLAAVTGLFNERLQDYGVFSRFLNSQEYVNSQLKGSTPRLRFEAFKRDINVSISIDDLRDEFSNKLEFGNQTQATNEEVQVDEKENFLIDEDIVLENINDLSKVKDLQTESSETKPVKVPRVKRTN